MGVKARHLRPRRAVAPAPGIAEPHRGQQMQCRGRGSAVDHRGAHQNIVDTVLRVFDEDIEVAVFVENSRVNQLVFALRALPLAIGLRQVCIGEGCLWIFIQRLHVGVRRRGVQVIVVFLDVLAMIAFRPRDSKQPLLQYRVHPVPKSKRETQALVIVADSGDAVFGPAIGPRARVIVREIIPRRAVGAVVFARIAPGSFREVRAPAPPMRGPVSGLEQAISFSGHSVFMGALSRAR